MKRKGRRIRWGEKDLWGQSREPVISHLQVSWEIKIKCGDLVRKYGYESIIDALNAIQGRYKVIDLQWCFCEFSTLNEYRLVSWRNTEAWIRDADKNIQAALDRLCEIDKEQGALEQLWTPGKKKKE